MKVGEAVDRLKELADQIYEALDEMEEIIRQVAPGELERAKRYWMAHIDGALINRNGWLGGSFINFMDTIRAIEEFYAEEDEEEIEE